MMKTLSFGTMHIVVAFLVVGLMTGDWMVGGAVALVEPCVNTVAYHFHERVWKHRNQAGAFPSLKSPLPAGWMHVH